MCSFFFIVNKITVQFKAVGINSARFAATHANFPQDSYMHTLFITNKLAVHPNKVGVLATIHFLE